MPAHMAPIPKDELGGSRPFCRMDLLALVLLVCHASAGVLLYYYCPSSRLLVYAVLSVVVVGGLWALLRLGRPTADVVSRRIFPLALILSGLLFLTFFTPNAAPDEDVHYGRAYSYMDALFFGADPHEMRVEDYVFSHESGAFAREMTRETLQGVGTELRLFAEHEGTCIVDDSIIKGVNVWRDLLQLRIAAVLGMTIARVLNLSGLMLFYFGRLFNFLFGAGLIIAAVRLTPVGKNAMMTIALLPMTVHLIASYSYDSGIIGLSMLLAALILRMTVGEGRASRATKVASVVVAALLGPCKTVYAAICVLALFVPSGRFGSRAEAIVWKLCMLLSPVCMIGLVKLPQVLSIAGVTRPSVAVTQRFGDTGELYTLGDVVSHPFTSVLIVLRTLFDQGDMFAETMVGGVLGQLQGELRMLDVQAYGCLGLLLMSAVCADDDDELLPLPQRIAGGVLCATGFAAIVMSMFTGWTLRGELVIQGVQGRYFLPFLPVLLLSLRGRLLEMHARFAPAMLLCLTSFNCIYLAQMLFIVLGAFGTR